MSLRKTSGFLPAATALGANILVTASKFVAAAVSGSSVLFSEAVHSTADMLNQVLLLIGLHRSLKKPDKRHDYGYGNERFFWALLSACGVFFLGAGITGYEGVHSIFGHHPIEFNWIMLAALAFSAVVEGYSFFVAAHSMQRDNPQLRGWRQIQAADSTTLAVYLEDSVAVLGIAVAILALLLSYVTNSTIWDGIGSIVIALLLGTVAIVLILKNRAYLLGQSLPREMEEKVIAMITAEPSIERVLDFKSVAVGLDVYRIKCEVEFNGDSLVREVYGGTAARDQYEEVRGDFEEFKRFAAEYADRVPRLMGRKIDEIEKKIRAQFPLIRHIDIEIN